jgi:hypothetical protein
MTGRERIEAAFSADGAREIGAVICYESLYVRDRWDDLTDYPWWFRRAPAIDRQMAWRRQVIERLGQDWMELPVVGPAIERERLSVELRADGAFLVDRFSGRESELVRESVGGWAEPYAKPQSAVVRLPCSRAEIDHLIPVPVSAHAFDADLAGRGELAQRLLAAFGERLFPICHVTSPLWGLYGRLGFEGMMLTIAERPALAAYACERLLAQARRDVHVGQSIGAAGVWIEDCMTDLISPADYRKLNVPFLRALASEIAASGMISIHYYCGNPRGKWESLLDSGADALALEEGKKGFRIDVDDVVDRVDGHKVVFGNLDAIQLLERGREEALRAEVARHIRAGRRNRSRFVMSVGSPVTPGTPPERVRLYTDLAHEFGAR